jgi:hypothetical protein
VFVSAVPIHIYKFQFSPSAETVRHFQAVVIMVRDEPTQSQLKTHRKMMRPAEAARYCGSTPSTFAKFRLYGTGPIHIKIGHRVVYDPDDLDHWLASRRRSSTSDRAPAELGRPGSPSRL